MVGATLLRFVTLSDPLLIAIAALAPWFLGVGVLATAALHDKKLCLVAALVVGLAVVVVLPGGLAPRTGCDVVEGRSDADLVVASQNVLFGLASPADIASQLQAVDPDVILLQEAEPGFVDAFTRSLDESYEHQIQSDFQVILSRYPVTAGEQLILGSNNVHTLLPATVDAPVGELSLFNVHAAPPHVAGERQNQILQFDYLEEQASQGPLLAMGDFNSMPADRAYRTLLSDGGLVDAHSDVGCGFGVTWSPLRSFGPALLGLDHAIVGPGWDAEAFEVLGNAGSDHKGIAVRISPS